MEVKLDNSIYRLEIVNQNIEWYRDNMSVPSKIVPRLERQVSEDIMSRIEKLAQLPNSLDVSAISELTGIKKTTLYSKIKRGKIRASEGDGRYRIGKKEVLELLSEILPVVENWFSAHQVSERYNIPVRTIRMWFEKGKLRGKKAFNKKIYVHPSCLEFVEEKNLAYNNETILVDGRYLLLTTATKRIIEELRRRNVHISPKEYRSYYGRYQRFLYENKEKMEKRGGRLFISEDMFNWLREHPRIRELSQIYQRKPEEIQKICEWNNIQYYTRRNQLPQRRVNQGELEKVLNKG